MKQIGKIEIEILKIKNISNQQISELLNNYLKTLIEQIDEEVKTKLGISFINRFQN
jgi:hypothetical protein